VSLRVGKGRQDVGRRRRGSSRVGVVGSRGAVSGWLCTVALVEGAWRCSRLGVAGRAAVKQQGGDLLWAR
jgi:hypothetical protein